jgi:hypothetical protein
MLIFISTGPLGHEEPSAVKEPSEVKELSAETALSIFEEAGIAAVASEKGDSILILHGQLSKKPPRI